MAQAKVKKLSCGGVGPCCHVGCAHKHCEHCDVVISLVSWPWQYFNVPYVPTVRPYQPYWITNGTSQQIGNMANAQGAAGIDFLNTHQGNTGDFAKALTEHTCAALPAAAEG